MGKIEKLLVAAFVVVLAITMIGLHSDWSKCQAIGGTTVRGLFGLECIK